MKEPKGTLFQTGCGHSWKRQYSWWTIAEIAGATTDCNVCGDLLIIPRDQFEHVTGKDRDRYPHFVRAELFHKWMNKETGGQWPADGNNTYSAEF